MMGRFNLSEWALSHRSFVLYLIIALGLAGVISYTQLGQAEDPDFTFKVMVIRSFWQGASAREVEQELTERIEKKVQEAPWFDYAQSYSKPGESLVFVTLKDYTPPKEVPNAWYQVRKKIGDIRTSLPEGVRGPYFNDEFGDTFGTIYAFTTDGLSFAELREYVDRVRSELLRIPGVGKVEFIGDQDEKIYLELSHRKLTTLGLDPLQFIAALQAQNTVAPSGSYETASDRVHLRVAGNFSTVEAVAEIGVTIGSRTFRLGDVGSVHRGYVDPPVLKFRYHGRDSIALSISMAKGGDIIALGRGLSYAMTQLRAALPAGIEVHQVADQPKVVGRSIAEFMKTLAEAVIIVLGVSFLSLGLRTGIVVALSIPLVLVVTFLCMKIFGIDLQRISLGALIIALGLLVDDAIIAVEMMAIKMEQGWDRVRAASFAYTSTAFSMLTGTLVTAAGFLPVGLARSAAGEYTFSIFAVVTISLLVSWVVAVLFIPYLGFRLLPERKAGAGAHEDVYQRPFYARFRRLVTGCVTYRKTTIACTVGAFVLALAGFGLVQQQFFPSANRPELVVDLWLPNGASFFATEEQARRFEKELAKDADVEDFVAYVGGGAPRFYLPLDQQLSHANLAEFVVTARDYHLRDALQARIQQTLDTRFTLLRGRVSPLQNGPPVAYPVQFRLSGRDTDQLRVFAQEVAAVMRDNPHLLHVNMNWNELAKSVRLDVDHAKARMLGITAPGLASALQYVLNGYGITDYRERDKLIEVLARAEGDERRRLEDLKDINVPTQSGRWVPLAQVARLNYGLEEGIIWRRDRLPTITIQADIADDIQAPVVSQQVLPKLEPIRARLPAGFRLETGGAIEESVRGQNSVNAVMPVMLLVVITLLMMHLQSMQKTILVLLTAPLGLIGVTLFLLVLHVPFGFVAMLGVIALFGMIMRNSIILVDQIDQDLAAGHAPWDAVIESTVRRFRPIVLTAAAAILAMIPLSQSNFWGPMAVAIMGGLLVATVLTLLFLPALYAAWFRVRKPA